MSRTRSLSGKPVSDLTLDAVRRGEVSLPDLRIHPDTLNHQASVARAHGNPQLAANLRRAAELTLLPDDELLAIYEALRPHRSTPRQLRLQVEEARVDALRAVDSATLTVPDIAPPTGRLRVLAAGVATPGGAGACVGVPLWLDRPDQPPPDPGSGLSSSGLSSSGRSSSRRAGSRLPESGLSASAPRPVIAVGPPGLGYAPAAERLRGLRSTGVPVGAVLVAGDEGVLIANRLGGQLPVIDQVDPASIEACTLLAVEARQPGQPLTLLADPVALGAALSLGDAEAADATPLSTPLLDYSNAVVGLQGAAADGHRPGEPWVMSGGQRVALRAA